MLRRIIRDFLQLHRALKRYYRNRARTPRTPEQEADALMRRYDAARRMAGRR